MNCHDVNAKLADLLFEETPETMIAEEQSKLQPGTDEALHAHLAQCQACSGQLAELRATMALLDTWEAPEPNPYFLTRLNARLDEEREAAPVGWPRSWFERLRARLVYGSRLGLRPVAAMSLSVMVLLGGGAYLGLNTWETPAVQPVHEAAVVNDLQTMDNNAQLLDQLEALSSQNSD
jgi:anti-sigma factor RsiW